MVNLGGNVSETVDLSARDSVIEVIENMVHATKNVRKASLWYVLNHENIFKAFSFLIPSANRISWQKTTWATIMSRNDKTCIILHFLTNKHFHLSAQSSFKCSYYSVSESKKISDISNPMLLGHLNTWNLSRNDKLSQHFGFRQNLLCQLHWAAFIIIDDYFNFFFLEQKLCGH